MWCTQRFAFLNDSNTIQNIIVCDDYSVANEIAKNIYGDDGYAIDVTNYAVGIGDEYRDGNFYRDGVLIEPEPSIEDKLARLFGETASLEEAACDIDGNVSERLSQVEEALCELAEMIMNKEN